VAAIEAVFAGNFSKYFSANKLSSINVAASLSGPSVIVKRLTMPMVSGEDLGESIREEVGGASRPILPRCRRVIRSWRRRRLNWMCCWWRGTASDSPSDSGREHFSRRPRRTHPIDPAIPRVEGVPALDTEGADTRILIANGGTVVIGGIILSSSQTTIDQVPFLGDIPPLGNLFKHLRIITSSQELLFFLTPRILPG